MTIRYAISLLVVTLVFISEIACYFGLCKLQIGGGDRPFSPTRLTITGVATAILLVMMVNARKQDLKRYGTKGYHFKLIGRTALLYEDNVSRLMIDAVVDDSTSKVVIYWSRMSHIQTNGIAPADLELIKIRIQNELQGRVTEWA